MATGSNVGNEKGKAMLAGVAPSVKAPVTEKAPVVAVEKAPITAPADSKFGPGRCPVCGKPVYRPKDGGLGATCMEHQGKLRQSAREASAVPEGWVRMSKVCDAAEGKGLTRTSVVKAAGGDACTGPILDSVFEVVYVGRGKWMHPDVLTKGLDLLLKGKAAPAPSKGKTPDVVSGVASALKGAIKS